MSLSDLNNILGDWPYEPNTVHARRIIATDGRPRIQLRLDLGVLQMELDGRPDGRHPHGFPSLLEYYREKEKALQGTDKESLLFGQSECSELQQEAAQYYYRYIAYYSLRQLDKVIEDTRHNIDLIELVDRHADDDELAWQFLQFFPYVRMMNARAEGELAAERGNYDEAIAALEAGIEEIRSFWIDVGEEEETERTTRETSLLSDLLRTFQSAIPKTESDRLEEELARAIAVEDYERAASLRDALRSLAPR